MPLLTKTKSLFTGLNIYEKDDRLTPKIGFPWYVIISLPDIYLFSIHSFTQSINHYTGITPFKYLNIYVCI